MTTNSRYEGRPLLRLLELYVLSAIGQLGKREIEQLEALTPYLQRTYARQGLWQDILEAELRLSVTTRASIRDHFAGFEIHMRQQGLLVDPQKYAEQFVDANFGV